MRVHKFAIIGSILLIASSIIALAFIISAERKLSLVEKPKEVLIITVPKRENQVEYKQIGIITSSEFDKEPIIMPLFARNVYGRGDRFHYYTIADKQHMIRLPVQFNNRECEDRIGCDELYNGDKITVSSYENREFTVTLYSREIKN